MNGGEEEEEDGGGRGLPHGRGHPAHQHALQEETDDATGGQQMGENEMCCDMCGAAERASAAGSEVQTEADRDAAEVASDVQCHRRRGQSLIGLGIIFLSRRDFI